VSLLEAIILGIIQGLTEFIPVSSSGHLVIAEQIMNAGGTESFHLFLQFINLGTLLALLIFYRKKIWEICVDIFKHNNWKLARNVLLTAIPAGLVGLLLSRAIEESNWLSTLVSVSIAMALIGVLMVIVDFLPKLSKVTDGEKLSPWRALTIGIVQILALIPGVSRSGSTILAGRVMGLNSKEAANYSFLASIPIMAAVMLKTFASSNDRAYFMDNLGVMVVGNIAAFVFGMLALTFVIKFLSKDGNLQKFGYYRIGLASMILIILFATM